MTLYMHFIIAFIVSNLESIILIPSLYFISTSLMSPLLPLSIMPLLVLRSQFITGKAKRHFSHLPLASDTTTTNPQNFLHFLHSYYSLICKIFQFLCSWLNRLVYYKENFYKNFNETKSIPQFVVTNI